MIGVSHCSNYLGGTGHARKSQHNGNPNPKLAEHRASTVVLATTLQTFANIRSSSHVTNVVSRATNQQFVVTNHDSRRTGGLNVMCAYNNVQGFGTTKQKLLKDNLERQGVLGEEGYVSKNTF